MKKIFIMFTIFSLVISILILDTIPGFAQSLAITPTISTVKATNTVLDNLQITPTSINTATVGDKNTFSFNDLGIAEQMMSGPYSSTSIPFSIPANWELIPGGEITLNFTYTQSMVGNNDAAINSNQIHGVLVVMLNDQTLQNIFLDKIGDYSVVIPIANQKALVAPTKEGRNLLRILLDASASCTYGDVQSTLLLKSTSTIHLEYQSITPSVDLSLFPRPIYQPDSIFHTKTILIIPDQPTMKELQAVLAVTTGLGMHSQGNLDLSVKTYKELTDSDKKSTFLIFVGKAMDYPILIGVNLPLSISKEGMKLSESELDIGVIQMAVSPWDNTKTILVVSANTDTGVLKAAQAVSTGKLFTSGRMDLSLVDNINQNKESTAVIQDQTLADLGYPTQTLESIGDNYLDILFTITPEQASTTDATIDLVVNHSNLLNEIGTTYSVFLNDQIISSDSFGVDSEQISTTQIKILPHLLKAGENRLEIFSNLLPYNTCHATDFSASWLTVSDTTSIHIPLPTESETAIKFNQTLKDYPSFFFNDPMLSDLAVVVPQNDPVSWEAAARISFYLGAKGNPSFTDLITLFGNNIPQDIRQNYHFLFIGRASTLPVISEINSSLPAPYDMKSDQANQSVMLVNYGLPAGVNVGYIQFTVSPWNPDKVVLSIAGNTEAGIPMAANVLSTDSLEAQLAGNYALINGNQVLTTNTQLGVGKGSLAENVPGAVIMTPAIQLTPTSYPESDNATEIIGKPAWLLPLLLGSSITFVLMLFVFVIRGLFLTIASKSIQKKIEQNQKNEPSKK